jgi:hypothetical protein
MGIDRDIEEGIEEYEDDLREQFQEDSDGWYDDDDDPYSGEMPELVVDRDIPKSAKIGDAILNYCAYHEPWGDHEVLVGNIATVFDTKIIGGWMSFEKINNKSLLDRIGCGVVTGDQGNFLFVVSDHVDLQELYFFTKTLNVE